ncbi:16S rRNA (guanine(527)-N(7))-methyltransferase RsmG [Thermanaeromonas sp. C210]|uniref:16S rRNA (guanine(527)-N(7))-methyltransferase RsmG n=1 Tax=Thermanaeromonas sp. C210 TaxID=2731925 RepID=UPI00155BB6F1|nr:16S rRNA (guanine(527)-N(7))-methyltransferase RsmG [Thermanaeromonas sp. C210]GFN23103.1 ribosomal RNA small subunit methyltransferase G [Thermanaeromonas sp. C210]
MEDKGLGLFLEEQGWKLSGRQLQLLSAYARLLLKRNRELNLTAVTEEQEVWRKHFLDSLLLFVALEVPPGARVVDVGSGGGLPGMVLKIYRPDLEVTLVEGTRKKAEFLSAAIRELGLEGIRCVWARAEVVGRQEEFRERFDLATARAVADLAVVLEYCVPLVRVGGRVVAYKGPRADEEIEGAARALAMLGAEVERVWQGRLPGGGEERRLVVVVKRAGTDPRWPRRPGIPEKRPL